MKLNEIKNLTEAAEKNLFGFKINGTEITKDTPNEVWIGDFNCWSNGLKSLEYCPKIVNGNFNCSDNKLKSLKGIHKQLHQINGTFFARGNPIVSNVIGILLVKGCKKIHINNEEVEAILNKYLPNTSGMLSVLECQSELIEAGYEDYAEL